VKVVFVVTLWKRPVLADSVLRQIRIVASTALSSAKMLPVLIGSEGEASRALAERYRFEYYEAPNVVSDKKNLGFEIARDWNADIVIPWDSDDFITERYLSDAIALDRPYVEAAGLYFFEVRTNLLVYLPCPGGVGPGRVIRRDVLDAVDWAPFKPGEMKGIDVGLGDRLKAAGFESERLPVWPPNGRTILDVKGHSSMEVEPTNIWSFGQIALRSSSLVLRPARTRLREIGIPEWFISTIWNNEPEDTLE
jgi:hypothetical protein